MRNSDNLTPWELFTDKHKELREEGQKWMKETVNFYIVVATLITAVVFTAAFTVPGGTNPDTGIPIMLKSMWFRIFFISDAIALLSSSASILMFLSILAIAQWVLGLITLFISIAGMVVAFSASCFLVFKSEMAWLPKAIIALAGQLIVTSVFIQLKLSDDIIHSTTFLLRPRKYKLF